MLRHWHEELASLKEKILKMGALTEDQVQGMRPGSVVVDLAAEQGGNCECTKPGEVAVVNGVAVHGPLNLASAMAAGKTLDSAAEDFGIKKGTARIELSHIYSKTATHRQAELVRLLLSTAVVSGD